MSGTRVSPGELRHRVELLDIVGVPTESGGWQRADVADATVWAKIAPASWSQQQKLTASDAAVGAAFGGGR